MAKTPLSFPQGTRPTSDERSLDRPRGQSTTRPAGSAIKGPAKTVIYGTNGVDNVI